MMPKQESIVVLVSLFLGFLHLGNAEENMTRRLYNNLTKLINEAVESDSETDYERLKNAINFSPDVFYETDLSLGNFLMIMPVINLLQRLEQDGMHPKLMLSLKYVSRVSGKFFENRTSDIFYNLHERLLPTSREKFSKYLEAVVLDFVVDNSDFSNSYFPIDYFQGYSLATTVKEFLQFHFGNLKIPVGVMFPWFILTIFYSREFNTFRNQEILQSDFVIYSTPLNLETEFPISKPKFTEKMQSFLYNHHSKLDEKLRNKKVSVSIRLSGNCEPSSTYPFPYFPFFNDWKMFQKVLAATLLYNTTHNLTLGNVYRKSGQLFNEIVGNWTLKQNQDVIISNPCHNYSSVLPIKKSLVNPIFKTQQENVDVCALKSDLALLMNRFDNIIVDEKTWMRLASYEQDIMDPNLSCAADGSALLTFPTSKMDAAIYFQYDIRKHWATIEQSIFALIRGKSKIATIHLKTLIFFDNDIKNSEQIVTFIETVKLRNISVGCSIDISTFIRYFQKFYNQPTAITPDLFKSSANLTLCNPVFELVDTFLWRVPVISGWFPVEGLFNAYGSLFLAREIFLGEFPSKKVLIKFESSTDRHIISQLYDAPVIVPFENMVF